MKKYKVIKDTPTDKAGDILELNEDKGWYINPANPIVYSKRGNPISVGYLPEWVEEKPEWFERIDTYTKDDLIHAFLAGRQTNMDFVSWFLKYKPQPPHSSI